MKENTKTKDVYIHPMSDVQTSNIGVSTHIWQYVIVFPNAIIGKDCNINAHCLIENDVVIGDRVTVKSGNYLWDGLRVEDDVFIGPNVTFANDKYPRSKAYPDSFLLTIIEAGASLGGGGSYFSWNKSGKTRGDWSWSRRDQRCSFWSYCRWKSGKNCWFYSEAA